MGDNTQHYTKEERQRYCTTLLLGFGLGDGLVFWFGLVCFLSGLHSSLNSYIVWSTLNILRLFLMPAPLCIKPIKLGLTTWCNTCQGLSYALQVLCSLIYNYYFSCVYFNSECA